MVISLTRMVISLARMAHQLQEPAPHKQAMSDADDIKRRQYERFVVVAATVFSFDNKAAESLLEHVEKGN